MKQIDIKDARRINIDVNIEQLGKQCRQMLERMSQMSMFQTQRTLKNHDKYRLRKVSIHCSDLYDFMTFASQTKSSQVTGHFVKVQVI